MTRLVLFCGGPAIYPGGVPKPLQLVDGESTLLELYLKTPFATAYSDVVLLCESDFTEAFRVVVKRCTNGVHFRLIETPSGSSTRLKLETYLARARPEEVPEVWTYPDIFYFGSLIPREQVDWSEQAVLSLRAMTSRFPRIVMDPYSSRVRSITTHQSVVPANPAHLFGGHLLASPVLVSRVLSEVSKQATGEAISLELGVFSWMINRGLMDAFILEYPWLQADGPRELRSIREMLETDGH